MVINIQKYHYNKIQLSLTDRPYSQTSQVGEQTLRPAWSQPHINTIFKRTLLSGQCFLGLKVSTGRSSDCTLP